MVNNPLSDNGDKESRVPIKIFQPTLRQFIVLLGLVGGSTELLNFRTAKDPSILAHYAIESYVLPGPAAKSLSEALYEKAQNMTSKVISWVR